MLDNSLPVSATARKLVPGKFKFSESKILEQRYVTLRESRNGLHMIFPFLLQ